MPAQQGLGRGLPDAGSVQAIGEQIYGPAAAGNRRSTEAGATRLVRIEPVLVERKAQGQVGVKPVDDELEGDPVMRGNAHRGEHVGGYGVELVVLDCLIRAHIADKSGTFVLLAARAVRRIVVVVLEAAVIGACFEAVDILAGTGVEVDRAAGGVVAVQRRIWTLDHVDVAVSVWVGQVGAGLSVGLGDRETVFKDLKVANKRVLPRVGAANRDGHVARTATLEKGDTGNKRKHLANRESGGVLELLAADSFDGLARGYLRDETGACAQGCVFRVRRARGRHKEIFAGRSEMQNGIDGAGAPGALLLPAQHHLRKARAGVEELIGAVWQGRQRVLPVRGGDCIRVRAALGVHGEDANARHGGSGIVDDDTRE